MWRVVADGQHPVEMIGTSFGQFFSEECFVVRWQYRVSYGTQLNYRRMKKPGRGCNIPYILSYHG